MEYLSKWKQTTIESKLSESKRMKEKYPDRIPVLVDRAHKMDPKINKHRFLVTGDLTVSQFNYVLRKFIQIGPESAIFLFFGGKLLASHTLMSTVRNEYGFIICTFSVENTFG